MITQYYKSQGDEDYGLNLGKDFSAISGTSTPYVSKGLHSDRIPGTERHLISLQYSNSDFFSQELVGQVYYRDESLLFYPFPTVNGEQTGDGFLLITARHRPVRMKLTLNSKPLDGWQITYGLDADHERFTSNQMFFNLAQSSASGGLNKPEDLHHWALSVV
ncbi:Aerobactin siderophore ferric receptor protein IutA [Salmonella enterica subsp. arizonae]|uniref:Aerobactin siderophore ferric receptor protein IutA n=1 Tax=Salmonella enterica subsp. arizonae TaxID=59203 RepID=A0A2X4TGE1_SALER|nr:Aerobactin siderophore ferric receptor protein IutA [Salmonella enterica subsp. arizonae]